jgi:hypothetical protein
MSENSERRSDDFNEAAVEAAGELSDAALDSVSGGFLVFQFKLVAVKTVG